MDEINKEIKRHISVFCNKNLFNRYFSSIYKIVLATALFLALVFAVTAAIPTLMSLQGTATGGTNLGVNISTAANCNTSSIFSETYPTAIDSDGYYNVLLGNDTPLELDYNNDYYLCIYINNELIGSPQKFRGGQGDIGDEDIESNINTYVDIAGDTMTGTLNLPTLNATTNATIANVQIYKKGITTVFRGLG